MATVKIRGTEASGKALGLTKYRKTKPGSIAMHLLANIPTLLSSPKQRRLPAAVAVAQAADAHRAAEARQTTGAIVLLP